jgi:hypothetical protein
MSIKNQTNASWLIYILNLYGQFVLSGCKKKRKNKERSQNFATIKKCEE